MRYQTKPQILYYRVVTKSGHMATSIVNSTMVHSIGSHALSFRDIDLEVGIKMFRRARPGQSAEKEVWFSVFRCLSVRHKLLRRLYFFLNFQHVTDRQTDI